MAQERLKDQVYHLEASLNQLRASARPIILLADDVLIHYLDTLKSWIGSDRYEFVIPLEGCFLFCFVFLWFFL